MARQARIPPVLNPRLAWYQFSLAAAQTMVDSAQVIALRTNRIVQAGSGPGIRDRESVGHATGSRRTPVGAYRSRTINQIT